MIRVASWVLVCIAWWIRILGLSVSLVVCTETYNWTLYLLSLVILSQTKYYPFSNCYFHSPMVLIGVIRCFIFIHDMIKKNAIGIVFTGGLRGYGMGRNINIVELFYKSQSMLDEIDTTLFDLHNLKRINFVVGLPRSFAVTTHMLFATILKNQNNADAQHDWIHFMTSWFKTCSEI